mgnify:CR=1 FL=1
MINSSFASGTKGGVLSNGESESAERTGPAYVASKVASNSFAKWDANNMVLA